MFPTCVGRIGLQLLPLEAIMLNGRSDFPLVFKDRFRPKPEGIKNQRLLTDRIAHILTIFAAFAREIDRFVQTLCYNNFCGKYNVHFMKPIVVVNFKTYPESTGTRAELLAKKLQGYTKKLKLIAAVQVVDVFRVQKKVDFPIFAQHADFGLPDKNTGFNIIESLQSNGAAGTILNHSEHQLPMEVIEKTVTRCRAVKFPVLVCVQNISEARVVVKFNPDMIAYEESSLISSGQSITGSHADKIKEFVKIVRGYNLKNSKRIIPLCGAGISSKKDLDAALALGTEGVLLASAIVKSAHPEKVLM